MLNLKYDTNELIYETDSQIQRTDLWLPEGRGGVGGDGLGVSDQKMKTIMYRIDKQQGPTRQHRELYSISCIQNHNGKEYEKEYICITESLCGTAEINTTL